MWNVLNKDRGNTKEYVSVNLRSNQYIKLLWSDQSQQTECYWEIVPVNMSKRVAQTKGFKSLWFLTLQSHKHQFSEQNKSQLVLPIFGSTSKEILARSYCTFRKWDPDSRLDDPVLPWWIRVGTVSQTRNFMEKGIYCYTGHMT